MLGYLYWNFSKPENYSAAALLLLNCIGAGIFVTKALGIIFVQMWIRWTLPRPRIDQVLYACVKVLLPLACALLLGAAIWQWLIPERPGIPWVNYNPFNAADWPLTDCLSFIVMADHGATEALTGDRHFRQAGFVPLLREP